MECLEAAGLAWDEAAAEEELSLSLGGTWRGAVEMGRAGEDYWVGSTGLCAVTATAPGRARGTAADPRLDRSTGGFAHVYLATSSTPIPAGSPNATTKHVLKRIAVPDKAGVEEVGKEVEVMVRSRRVG